MNYRRIHANNGVKAGIAMYTIVGTITAAEIADRAIIERSNSNSCNTRFIKAPKDHATKNKQIVSANRFTAGSSTPRISSYAI